MSKPHRFLLQHLIAGRDRRARIDPISLANWIPRLLRAVYRRLQPKLMRDVTIMVASSICDRPMVVETAKVGEILFDAVRNGLHGMSGTFPFDIIGCGVPFVLLPNTCGVCCTPFGVQAVHQNSFPR